MAQSISSDDGNRFMEIQEFPQEVLLQITSHLTTNEYCSLRLTSKPIEAALLTKFSKEFFTKRQFMLTEFSLQALIDISKSRFSSNLRHVIFGLERPFGSEIRRPDPNSAQLHNYMFEESLSHASLLNTAQDVEMIAEAFSNLPGLAIVGLRDFNSRSRYRDNPHIEWKSYGWPSYLKGYLNHPRHNPNFDYFTTSPAQTAYLNRTFMNLFLAIGKSHSLPAQFEVILRSERLEDAAFKFPPRVDALIYPVLANLKTLFLDLKCNNYDPVFLNDGSASRAFRFQNFISKFTRLEHMRVNFDSRGSVHNLDLPEEVLSWLSEPIGVSRSPLSTAPSLQGLPSAPPPVCFANLKSLEIGIVQVRPKILIALLEKYQTTLKSISFHKITLLPPAQVIYDDNDEIVKVSLWAKFFGQLSKLNLELSAINLSSLSQLSHRLPNQNIQVLMQATFRGARVASVRKWAGTNTQSGLRDLADEVQIEWPEDPVPEPEPSEESDEDMDSEMMDDDEDGEDD